MPRIVFVLHGGAALEPAVTAALVLAVEAEGAGDNAVDRRVEVAIGFDDDRVFAAHLENGPLDEDLAGLGFRCALVNLEADGF